MERDHPRPGVLAPEADPYGIPRRLVVATPDLGRHGQVRVRRHGLDDALDQVHVPEASRAPVPLHDLLYRTPKVDVDEVRPEQVRHQGRGLPHGLGVRPEDLDADGPLVLVESQVIPRLAVALHDAVGAHELGGDDVRSEAAAKPSKRRLAHARLGREEKRSPVAREELEEIVGHMRKGMIRIEKGEGQRFTSPTIPRNISGS